MAVLLTGGAGYVGSHCAKLLRKAGERVIILDDLRKGHLSLVQGELVRGSIGSPGMLDEIFKQHAIDAVMDFAAYIEVGESVQDPARYYQNNFAETVVLVREMLCRGIQQFVFSSTAAVYGEPLEVPISETHSTVPVNPYGRSKLMVEQFLADCAPAYGLRSVALRYFNAAGSDPENEIGERHEPESHLIPRVLEIAYRGSPPLPVYGHDYPTPDGTCIRDYVHVNDIAHAHLLALDYLRRGGESRVFNVGSERGYSVLEVLDATERITGRTVPREFQPRRPGDAARLVASSEKIRAELAWRPQYGLEDIIASAWEWRKKLGESYRVVW